MKKQLKKVDEVEYNFTLDGFSGPLDLLLHLARTNEIEISNISLDTLIDQYLTFIENVQENGVNIASTYLEMAAELIRLKSKMLLPNNENADLEFIEELEELGLNREQLIEKLLEYKKYKDAALKFDALQRQRTMFLTREPDSMASYRKKSFISSLDLDLFSNAAENYIKLELMNSKKTKTITSHEIGTAEHIENFKNLHEEFKFYERIHGMSMEGIIALFLAILESLKLQYISFVVLENDLLILPYQKEINEQE